MWIDKDIIPALIDAVEKTIQTELNVFDEEDFNQDEHFDGNDLVISDSFVLHTLRENINCGFYSSEMLDKGFGFMMGLVQWYLRYYGHTLPEICYGKLARLHYEYYIKEVISYIGYIEPNNIKENIHYINHYIERAMFSTECLANTAQTHSPLVFVEGTENKVVSLRRVSDLEGKDE